MKTKELRKELIEFLEANNYFISTLKTKKNAIGIVDSYLKNYKGLMLLLIGLIKITGS